MDKIKCPICEIECSEEDIEILGMCVRCDHIKQDADEAERRA